MKRLLATVMFVGALFFSAAVVAAERTVTLAVENMSCATCPYIVKKAIAAVPGVSKVEVSYEKKTAIVTFDDATTSLEAVTGASANAGYPARLAGQGE